MPTPKGEVEYDNFIFQLQMLRSSYMDDTFRNAIVASVRTHAKIAIRAIGYGSSLDAMIEQLENRFGLGGNCRYTWTAISPIDAAAEREGR